MQSTVTAYDILGVVPAATDNEIAAKYRALVMEKLDDDFYCRSSLRHTQEARYIQKWTDAFLQVSNSETRERYNRRLAAKALICSLCDGRGKIEFRNEMRELGCIACKGTGKGAEYI